MVTGLAKFRQFFGDHADDFVVIGGVAMGLLLDEAALSNRNTNDIDMVLCVDVINGALAGRFDAFLKAGDYQKYQYTDGKKRFYRFSDPRDGTFPKTLELFARPPSELKLDKDARYVRLDVEDAQVSLSALLLNEAYYDAIKDHRRIIDEIPILQPSLLIPFKARAYLDLADRKEAEKIDSNKVLKHARDIFRLIRLLRADRPISLPVALQDDVRSFVAAMEVLALKPRDFDVNLTKEEGLAILTQVYSLGDKQ